MVPRRILVTLKLCALAAVVAAAALSPQPGPAEAVTHLPDLVVENMLIELETGGACDFPSTQLGVRVVIANVGSADTGPFVVDVNGSQQTVTSGLGAGESLSLWFAGYAPGFGENTAFVDATFQIEESDEGNNQLSQVLPLPTLPLPCTPTPTPIVIGGFQVPLETGGSPGQRAGIVATLAAMSAAAIALGGAAWYTRRRRG